AHAENMGNLKVCFTHMNSIGGYPKEGSYEVVKLILDRNCTHIIGNLILTGINRKADGSDPDLGFLKSIQEISGYLIIMHSNVNTIPLSNLRVIRANNGGYKIHDELDFAALVIRKNYKDGGALNHVDLRSLKSIVRGSVYIYDNPGLRYLPNSIYWTELFESVGEQKVYSHNLIRTNGYGDKNITIDLHRYEHNPYDTKPEPVSVGVRSSCSNLCPEIGNETYCWGPTALECQYQSKCQNLLCNRCLKIRNSYSCCHEQCLGGCTGTLASQCVSCKEYYNSGTCVAHCPSRTIIHGGKLIPNPDFKYRLGNLCLSVCPDGFMVEGDVCVTHCSTGSMSRDGRVCVPCQDKCPKPCKITDKQTINGRKMSNLDLKSLNQLINCTILEGNLILTKDSFNPSANLTDHIPITDHRQLWALHSLREITGYIYLDLELLGDSLKNFSFLENLVKVGGYLPSARVSIMIMNSMAYFPGLRSLRQVPHGRVIFHKNPNLCYLSSLPWVNSAPISTFNTLNQTNSMQFTIIDGPSDDYCESFNYVCHPACKKEYGCWGPGPDQCVRCAYRRAGLYTCVQSCNDLSGFMSEQSEKHFRKSEKEKNYHDTSLALEAEGVCIPCHPECGKSCTGPGAHECIGSCKTAWSEGQCVSECQPTTYLNMDRRICEPCHTHCHQRQLTKQPVCTGPGRHPGKGGCNKCEKFVVQSPLNQINTELADYSPSINTVSLLCIRGDCPPGTYLTTEVVQPNTLFAKYAEIFTSVAAVCRSCHPRCSVCTAYSLLKANEQRLGCIKCNGFWLRDACVDHCPMEQTYSIWITTNGSISRKSSQENLSLDDNNVKYSGVYVRHLNGQCLACHEQCHAGCWGPGPDQCNHCLNVKVPIRFLSDNLTRIYVLNRIVEDGSTVEVNSLNLHLYHGKFICLSQCPNALYNHINNIPEMDGETLCHHSAYLSDSDHELIVHDNLYPFQYFDNHALSNNNEKLLRETSAEIIGLRKSSYYSSANGSIMHRKLKNDPIILFIIPLCILLIIFAVLIITCYRYRSNQQFIKKYEHNPLLLLKLLFCPLSLISQRFISNISGYKYQKGNPVINLSPTSYYYNNNNGENGLEVNLMPHSGTDESLLRRPSVPPSHRYPNQIVNGQKAPNLGRLIMINLDDLCLNEKSGPLGTGAFGAVYQGIWKVCQSDYPNLPNLNHVITANNEEELMLKVNSQNCRSLVASNTVNGINVLPTSHISSTTVQENEMSISATRKSSVYYQMNNNTDEDNSRNSNSSATMSKAATDKSRKEFKLLCVAVKILNEVRGSSDLQALLDEAKVMASVSHYHCLPLLGICLSHSRKCLVSAYVVNGSLDRYLRLRAPNIDSLTLLNWASQIADGMAYLQSRGIIHRDLATRNVLVTSPEHLQITDFGLAKMLESDVEAKRNEVIVCSGRVPIRWLACETLTHRIYSFKTDVWAYGVTIWEIFTFGDKPFDRIETANVKDHVLAGGRLPQPDICTLELYQVMLNCWNENPDARPNFVDLYNMFKDFSRQPHLYLHSRNDSSSNTEVYCSTGDTRSRATIYPTARLSGERLRQSDQTVPSFQSMKSGDSSSPLQNSSSGSGLPNRRFDTGRRTRTSLLLPPTNLQANRIGKYPRHKRRSVGARTEYTMSTSLSVNSGIGERWSHSSFATQSHPTLIKVDETSGTGDIGHNFKINSNTPGNNRNNEQFNVGLFSTDSWASSGQPLLSSDQESSLSHLMLSNFGYTSSESRSSMAISSPSQHNRNFSSGGLSLPTESRNSEQPSVDEFTPNIQRNALPVNTSFEAAAGYVWPQWPDAIPNPEQNNSNQVNSGEMSYVLNTIDGESENTLPFLNRQLWLRRNARQRRYYLRQLQIHRSVADSSLPEQAGEDAADESSGWAEALGPNQSNPNGPQEDSDTDQGSADRYWPDPTYSPQNV
ncbi:Tyrosine-protein kinase transforming protein, partial [Schistosoma japonicum]